MILDIFSRYAVGWTIQHRESSAIAERLIAQATEQHGVEPGQLTLHADRGTSMTSKPVSFLLADLGVTKTHSRPYTSSDNPFSEVQFKTCKYRPDFPDRFTSIHHSRSFGETFFDCYNHDHRHSGIGLMTPAAVHYGQAELLKAHRQRVLAAACKANPDRLVHGESQPPELPAAVWINPPDTDEDAH